MIPGFRQTCFRLISKPFQKLTKWRFDVRPQGRYHFFIIIISDRLKTFSRFWFHLFGKPETTTFGCGYCRLLVVTTLCIKCKADHEFRNLLPHSTTKPSKLTYKHYFKQYSTLPSACILRFPPSLSTSWRYVLADGIVGTSCAYI